jgi:hypothetical protein
VAGFVLLSWHVVLSNIQLGGVDFVRFFSSCALLIVELIGAQYASSMILRAPAVTLARAADAALLVMTFLAIAAALGAPAIGPQASSKAVVIFAEPSNFATAFIPMLLFRAATSRRGRQFMLIGIALALAVLLQSLTMLVSVLIVAALLVRRAALIPIIFGIAIGAFTLDLSYYADRLSFSSDTDNTSTLVFLQGWENALLNFRETYGFGVGFQQFGIVGSSGVFSEKLFDMLGADLNRLDGGSLTTKLIAEFGVLGVLATILFLRFAFRCATYIRQAQRDSNLRDTRRILLYSLIVTYSFELLMRGSGYFTPGGFLFLTAAISIHRLAASKGKADPVAPPISPVSYG